MNKRWGWLVVPVAVASLAGCSSTSNEVAGGADLAPVVLSPANSSDTSAAPSAGSVTGGTSSSVTESAIEPVTDPMADLDIDDQVGDGLSVIIESVDTDLPNVHIVIETRDGLVLGSDLRTAGLQPVTLRLDQRVPERTKLVGRMLADDGDGILEIGVDRPVIDNEGELVAEDFDYVFSPDTLADD